MSFFIGEYFDVYDERRRKARVLHVCIACSEHIVPGHTYWSVSTVGDGTAQTLKRCERCQAIHVHLRLQGRGETWPIEALDCGEDYREEWGGDPPGHIEELAFITPEQMQEKVHG